MASGEVDTKGGVSMGDFLAIQTTSVKLCGVWNYLQWAKAVEFFVEAKGKHDYIIDNPPADGNKMKEWQQENSQVMTS